LVTEDTWHLTAAKLKEKVHHRNELAFLDLGSLQCGIFHHNADFKIYFVLILLQTNPKVNS
jgi:hypothetical protein